MTTAAVGPLGPSSRIAVVHIADPRYSNGGADRRAKAINQGLSRSFETTLHRLEVPPQPVLSYWRLRCAASGIPPRAAQSATGEVRSALEEIVAKSDVVVASTLMTAALVPPGGRLIFDAHNVEWRVVRELAHRNQGLPRRLAYRATTNWTRSFEARLAAKADALWAVSRQEADWFRQAGANVSVVPNGVDLPQTVPPVSATKAILFVGSLESVFNREAVMWFLDQVWPAVRTAHPDATFTIVGAGPRFPLPEGAIRVGYVEDLLPLYAASTLCVAPLRAGAGTRLKIPEAMAHGRPVVSTTIGAEGLDVEESDGVLLADGAEDFAAACVRVLSDPAVARGFGRRARLRAESFSWPRVTEPAIESVRRIVGS